jgi:hypothetical protein
MDATANGGTPGVHSTPILDSSWLPSFSSPAQSSERPSRHLGASSFPQILGSSDPPTSTEDPAAQQPSRDRASHQFVCKQALQEEIKLPVRLQTKRKIPFKISKTSIRGNHHPQVAHNLHESVPERTTIEGRIDFRIINFIRLIMNGAL